MSGILLGLEIFIGFTVGYWLLRCAQWAWRRYAGRAAYRLRVVWRVALRLPGILLKAFATPLLMLAGFGLVLLVAYKVGESHRALVESFAGVLGFLGLVAIPTYLIYRAVRRVVRH
jgi:hypothetical protein